MRLSVFVSTLLWFLFSDKVGLIDGQQGISVKSQAVYVHNM